MSTRVRGRRQATEAGIACNRKCDKGNKDSIHYSVPGAKCLLDSGAKKVQSVPGLVCFAQLKVTHMTRKKA